MTGTSFTRDVDGASLRVFRGLFGAIMLIAVVRFFAHGWIDEYFYQPRHFFHYAGFEWVHPWPRPWMHVHFAVMGAAAICVMVGFHHRIAAAVLGALFAYAHLCDVTNYLNHYYLLIQVSFLIAILPSGDRVPAWAVWAARAQIGVVYVFGGIAKLSPDWLWHGEPLRTWLDASGLLLFPSLAVIASWAAALFDLTIVGWLLWRRSRPFAYAAVVAFHLITAKLFHLGMFPWAMIAFATIFFAPDWPRRWQRAREWGARSFRSTRRPEGEERPSGAYSPYATEARRRHRGWIGGPNDRDPHSRALGRPEVARAAPRIIPAVIGVHLAIQVLLPFRAHLYGGNPMWHEHGFRFAWKVMLMEKSGVVDFDVRDPDTGRTWRVPASAYYTRYQAAMMATQPDLIAQAAHVVADDFRHRGVASPEVRADSFVSLNGRPRARFVDPSVDLARRDVAPVLPAPEEPPP